MFGLNVGRNPGRCQAGQRRCSSETKAFGIQNEIPFRRDLGIRVHADDKVITERCGKKSVDGEELVVLANLWLMVEFAGWKLQRTSRDRLDKAST